MLRLPPFIYHRPRAIEEAVDLLVRHEGDVMPVAGGTDLIPNMKHRLFEPGHLVALRGVEGLAGIRVAENGVGASSDGIDDRTVAGAADGAPHGTDDGERDGAATGTADGAGERAVRIGATETLASVAASPRVRSWFPALAEAAGNVAGPQLRNAGTLGGNLCLDTRCTYYNQTEFWREALGFCLKKDGDTCHVTKVGRKCVAAHSADTPPVLAVLGAEVELVGPEGRRTIPVDDFFVADGIWNSRREPAEIVTSVRIPSPPPDLRMGYAKLRQRRSIDFPLLTVAVAGRVGSEERIRSIRGVVTALGSRPKELTGWDDIAVGEALDDEMIDALAQRAHSQCHPLENIIVDPEWRRAMVPVYVRRALRQMVVGRASDG